MHEGGSDRKLDSSGPMYGSVVGCHEHSNKISDSSAEETGGSQYKLLGPRAGAQLWCTFLDSITICRVHKLTLSDKAQVTLQLTVSLPSLVWNFLVSPPLVWKGVRRAEKISSPGLEPALGSPVWFYKTQRISWVAERLLDSHIDIK
jgi:hypothetical protein